MERSAKLPVVGEPRRPLSRAVVAATFRSPLATRRVAPRNPTLHHGRREGLRLDALGELGRIGDADAEVAQEAVADAVDPAVDGERLIAPPRFLHDGGLADVDRLLDHVELAETCVTLGLGPQCG